jgi:hypothetical protein
MFGFFTYELRVGHAHIWSTAQGRFGRALRVTGVQHPAPTLFCTCKHTPDEVTIDAAYAMAVQNGNNITADPPRTEIWALLYAQVHQADGKDFRNILLDDRKLTLIRKIRGRLADPSGTLLIGFENRDAPARGTTRWTQAEISTALRDLGLPLDAPLSVLCVEMMPTLAALRAPQDSKVGNNLAAAVASARSGQGSIAGAAVQQDDVRPLSDALGNYRILRTSPLTPVPKIC